MNSGFRHRPSRSRKDCGRGAAGLRSFMLKRGARVAQARQSGRSRLTPP
jgi:hypothetical protein